MGRRAPGDPPGQELRAELELLGRDIDDAKRRYDLNRAAELRYGTLADLERRQAAEEERLAVKQGEHRLREVVTEDEIAVSSWTGTDAIPGWCHDPGRAQG